MMSHNNHSKNDSNSNDFEANEVIDLAGTGNEIGNTRVGGKCQKCACGRLEVDDATGFQYFLMGHFPVVMSNVLLATALITLAETSSEEKCKDAADDDSCDGKIYGFKPSSLITIIATISGVLSAFILPIMGAIIDFTNHRKVVGIIIAVLLISIQAIQILISQSTWFPMAILQAINGFLYQAIELVAFSYLPEIECIVGEATMTMYTSRFYSWAFTSECSYVIIVIGISVVIKADNVLTAQLGQVINVLISGIFYVCGFYYFGRKQSRRELPEGHSLVVAGFKQVYATTKGIYNHYPTTLTWFFVAVVLGETVTIAFTTVVVTFLVEVFQFDATKAGMSALLALVSTIPGSVFSRYLMRKTSSPLLSMKICLIVFMVINFVSFPTLSGPEVEYLVWIYSVFWGFMIGWFYPIEVNIYALLMPKGQESELAGFYLYCTQILVWLPPLVFTIMNENDIHLKYGGLHLNIYLFLALICYQMMPSWQECVDISNEENKITSTNANNVEDVL